MSSKVVYPRASIVRAIQVPKADPSIAAKDQEEKMRAIAAWLDAQKAVDISFDNVYIGFKPTWATVRPNVELEARRNDWILADGQGKFAVVTNKTFLEEYAEVFER